MQRNIRRIDVFISSSIFQQRPVLGYCDRVHTSSWLPRLMVTSADRSSTQASKSAECDVCKFHEKVRSCPQAQLLQPRGLVRSHLYPWRLVGIGRVTLPLVAPDGTPRLGQPLLQLFRPHQAVVGPSRASTELGESPDRSWCSSGVGSRRDQAKPSVQQVSILDLAPRACPEVLRVGVVRQSYIRLK